MSTALCRKLEQFVALSAADRQLLEARTQRVERCGSHFDLVREGDEPRHLTLVLDGWVCRYKQLDDGRRQIIGFLIPGDLCDPWMLPPRRAIHALGTLTPVTIARVLPEELAEAAEASAALRRALGLDMLAGAETQREWTVSLGRRTATERLAHLFCEIAERLRVVGLCDESGCDMPVTQADLGDALGLSAVHVNRTLQELRATGLVELRGRRLIIRDETALQRLAQFHPRYLQA